jgi:hypothetical protein
MQYLDEWCGHIFPLTDQSDRKVDYQILIYGDLSPTLARFIYILSVFDHQ